MSKQRKYKPRRVKAEYQDTEEPLYEGNPLIEALPPILSPIEFAQQISRYPKYKESYRERPYHRRLHSIHAASKFFQPITYHIELEQAISRLIRQGYIERNPVESGFWDENDDQIEEVRDGRVYIPSNLTRNSTLSMSLMGFSGMGKTTSLKEILTNGYPQIIQHESYEGRPFSHYQLTWLMAECPHDGSTRQLCVHILDQLEALVGFPPSLYKQKSRANTGDLMAGISRLAQFYSVGMIVVDEIQRLHVAKSQGAEQTLNFFVQLVNRLGVPIMLVGTPDMQELFSSRLSIARRMAGQGNAPWNPLKKGSDWSLFVRSLWKYQYTKKQTPLTDRLNDCLYDMSQGILDIAVKVYMLTQIRAIGTKVEKVSVSLMESVCQDKLAELQPMLKALRENDHIALRAYRDMKPIDLPKYIKEAIRERNMKAIEQTVTQQLLTYEDDQAEDMEEQDNETEETAAI